jgi:translation initiation factor IF-2
MSAGDTPPKGFIGDAVIRFGGAKQDPSTETLPFTKTRAQLAAEKTEAELKAKQEADARTAAELKAKDEAKAAADKLIADAKVEAARILAAAKAAAAKKTTITCIKGKLTKKVTAVKPRCPVGYKVKK